MSIDKDVEQLMEICLRGDRREVRSYVDTRLARHPADELLVGVVLPAIARAERIEREDRATASAVALCIVAAAA